MLKHTLLSAGCIFLDLFIPYFSSMKLSNVFSTSEGNIEGTCYSQAKLLFYSPMIAAAARNLWSSLLDVNDDDDDGSNNQTLVSLP